MADKKGLNTEQVHKKLDEIIEKLSKINPK